MDVFAQKKLLIRIIVFLVFLNLTGLSIFIWKEINHNPPHLRGGFRPPFPAPHRGSENKNKLSHILKEKLDLNEKQVMQFDKLRTEFHKKENRVLSNLRAGRDSMNIEMFNEKTDEKLLNSIAKRVSKNEFKIELLKIEQAKRLKEICNPEQLEKFEDLMFEMRDYFKPEHKRKYKIQ